MIDKERVPSRIEGSGDGWAHGPAGAPVWGVHGAAGLFLVAAEPGREPRLLLQLRAPWTNQGGTWGIPGGARDLGESAEDTALREAVEECGLEPAAIEVLWSGVTCGPVEAPEGAELPGGWTYTTVIAQVAGGGELTTTANEESDELRWVPLGEVPELPLLGAFGDTFGELADRARDLVR